MNVFIALKGSHFWFLFDFTAAGVVPCGGRKTSPRTSTIVQVIFYFGPLRSAIIFWEIRNKWLFVCLCWGLTSQSTIFQSCRDRAIASWVINQYFRGVKCLAQGHNTAAVGIEPPTSRSGVRHSTTEPPRSPNVIGLDSYSRQIFIYLDPILIYISLWIDCLFEIRKIAVFPLAFIAGWLQGHWWGFISRNYVVWPTFLLMNVFIALKGSRF